MKKCGQVTYAKQLSAALEQEGIELTLDTKSEHDTLVSLPLKPVF